MKKKRGSGRREHEEGRGERTEGREGRGKGRTRDEKTFFITYGCACHLQIGTGRG